LVLLVVAIMALVIGFGSVVGGIVGVAYTWDQAAAQDITTPTDATIAEVPVRGPFTMKAQADAINKHQLESAGGLYYAQMPRQIQDVDEAGNPVFDDAGEPVMVTNQARAGWITATTLITTLSLGVMAYMLSAFAIVSGLGLLAIGVGFLYLRRPETQFA
jgi:hypothetical protein